MRRPMRLSQLMDISVLVLSLVRGNVIQRRLFFRLNMVTVLSFHGTKVIFIVIYKSLVVIKVIVIVILGAMSQILLLLLFLYERPIVILLYHFKIFFLCLMFYLLYHWRIFRSNLLLYFCYFFFCGFMLLFQIFFGLNILLDFLLGFLQRLFLLFHDLELFYDVDCNRAKVSSDKRHATLLISGYKQRATSTETVTIVLAGHSIASIDRAKNVARQLSCGQIWM